MNYEVLHNGKNIVGISDISKCFSVDRYGGMLDDLTIVLTSESNTIEFNKDDEIEIKTAGGFTTGIMYLDSCESIDGKFTIMALSCKREQQKKKSRIWNHPKLSKIISDVASNTGLTPLLYGFKDYSYSGIAQIMEADLQFLSRLCKREGYSIKCDNGNLIIFNEYYLENNSTPIEISKSDVESDYIFNRSVNGLASLTVRYFNTETLQSVSYTATDNEISGGEDIRIMPLKDINEAQRFANGYLREANKLYITGAMRMSYNGKISAGTVTDLKGFDEFDGRYVIYEAKHDFTNEKTTIKVRKVLGY